MNVCLKLMIIICLMGMRVHAGGDLSKLLKRLSGSNTIPVDVSWCNVDQADFYSQELFNALEQEKITPDRFVALIKSSKDLQATNDFQDTLFHRAAQLQKPEKLNVLIEKAQESQKTEQGVDDNFLQNILNIRNCDNNTVIQVAMQYGCRDNVKLLIRAGADLTVLAERKKNLLHLAKNDLDTFLLLAKAMPLEALTARDKYGATPLHYVAEKMTYQQLIELLEIIREQNKNTSELQANPEFIATLLTIDDGRGNTPLNRLIDLKKQDSPKIKRMIQQIGFTPNEHDSWTSDVSSSDILRIELNDSKP